VPPSPKKKPATHTCGGVKYQGVKIMFHFVKQVSLLERYDIGFRKYIIQQQLPEIVGNKHSNQVSPLLDSKTGFPNRSRYRRLVLLTTRHSSLFSDLKEQNCVIDSCYATAENIDFQVENNEVPPYLPSVGSG